jgi:hypothetical protein
MVLGVQYEDDARRLLEALEERLGRFCLAIHEGKTKPSASQPWTSARRSRAVPVLPSSRRSRARLRL